MKKKKKSRSNIGSATIFNKQTTNTTNLIDRMQRSKSYKDLFDPPSPGTTNPHHVYYQPQTSANRSSQNVSPSAGISSLNTNNNNNNNLNNDNNTNNNNNNLYPYYSSSFYYQNNNAGNPSSPTAIVGSMLGNASTHSSIEQHSHLSGLTDFQRRQQSIQHSSSSNNLVLDDGSSSSTVSHLPKPPPGIPSQHARHRRYKMDNISNRQKDNNSREASLERSPMT